MNSIGQISLSIKLIKMYEIFHKSNMSCDSVCFIREREGKQLSLTCPVCCSGFAVGIYTTNSPEACQYVAESCKANIIVVENHKQLQKILQVRSRSITFLSVAFLDLGYFGIPYRQGPSGCTI